MQQYKTLHNSFITDTYIRLEYVKDIKELAGVFTYAKVRTNLEDPDSFIKDLIECESCSPKNKNTDSIYGVILSFMLDQDSNSDKEVINKLVDQIACKYKELPHYCFMSCKGNAVFINIYLCEREYNPKGLTVKHFASKDIYRNKATGRACSKDDAGAYLYKAKGEVVRETTNRFTSKKGYFRYASAKQFLNYMAELKAWFIDVYKTAVGIVIKTGVSFKKFIIKNTRNKGVARIFNSALKDMEKDYMKRRRYLEELNDNLGSDETDKQIQKLEQIYKLFNRKIQDNETFKYKRKIKFSLDLDVDKNRAIEVAELLKEYFGSKLLKVDY